MKNFLTLLGFCLFHLNLNAQVVTQATNQQFIKNLLQLDSLENIPNVLLLDLPNQELTALAAADQINEAKGSPWRFAKLVDVNISAGSTGSLQSAGKYWAWAVKIKTNNAKSLSITFKDLTLSCHVDVTGASGDCFRMEQRAVARTLINNSTGLCTATLINNTNAQNDLRPFLITANHCSFPDPFTQTEINFANLGIRFLYYQGNSSIITFIGAAQRVATGAISDCSLLEMNQRPSANHGLFYLGWDRTTTAPTTGTVLSHPGGELMKISRDADGSITNPAALNFGRFPLPASRAWRFDPANNVAGGDFGAWEGGSSGSALINPIHRIVGDGKGGDLAGCDGGNEIWFGRFDISYATGTTPATRLENWLNPSFNNTPNLNATFQVAGGGNVIPCTLLRQEIFVPF